MKLHTLSIVAGISILSLFTSCETKEEGNLTIHGTIQDAPSDKIFFYHVGAKELNVIDTATIESDGSYELIANIDKLDFYQLGFNSQNRVNVITQSGENITINASGNSLEGTYTVSGSEETSRMKEVILIQIDAYRKQDSIKQLMQAARQSQDMNRFIKLNTTMQIANTKMMEKLKTFAEDNSHYMASLVAVQNVNPDVFFPALEAVVTGLEDKASHNFMYQNIASKVNSMKLTQIGSTAPDLSFPSPEGKVISLSSLQGKYVLLDFWASWCKPCRMENPNVVKLYSKYNKEGFEVFSVSLDESKEKWLQAIEQDGLEWTHVSDLKGWQAEPAKIYGVSAIPQTYLLDPQGVIIAKNLRGPELEQKLQELFGS
tara:strand:+ start:558 stop:1676 length:1119 start_codon:yes stop_codon:yes gene_type:complete